MRHQAMLVVALATAATDTVSVAASASATAAEGPCDIYARHGTPCVAAHSTARALFAAYAGPLYRVQRASDGATADIGPLTAGGFADAAAQEAFCPAAEQCTVSVIFDQSPKGNHIAPPTTNFGKLGAVNATKLRLTASGHPVYAAVFEGKMGYRNDSTTGVATGDEPESIYMVVAGDHYNDRCCFDYGNAEPDMKDDGTGSMEAVYWGNASGGTMNHGGAGKGPWVQADLEKGLWSGNTTHMNEPPVFAAFVTGMVKGRPGGWALKGGDAQQGPLTTFYAGVRPSDKTAGYPLPGGGNYSPMRKEGAIILGVGGDNSYGGVGTFLEGAMTTGFATDAADAEVQANIVAASYGK